MPLLKKDSLTNEICKTIKSRSDLSDSVRILYAFEMHVYPYLLKYPEERREEIRTNIFFRSQRNCNEFNIILGRLEQNKSDWEVVAEKPSVNINKKTCKQFLKNSSYTYLEYNGDPVHVKIENGFWVDNFKDGTFSKLKFEWISECEFELEFIESNNKARKNFSKVGDKYRYQILDKETGYYQMSAEISGQNRFAKFKMYF